MSQSVSREVSLEHDDAEVSGANSYHTTSIQPSNPGVIPLFMFFVVTR